MLRAPKTDLLLEKSIRNTAFLFGSLSLRANEIKCGCHRRKHSDCFIPFFTKSWSVGKRRRTAREIERSKRVSINKALRNNTRRIIRDLSSLPGTYIWRVSINLENKFIAPNYCFFTIYLSACNTCPAKGSSCTWGEKKKRSIRTDMRNLWHFPYCCHHRPATMVT